MFTSRHNEGVIFAMIALEIVTWKTMRQYHIMSRLLRTLLF